MSQEQLDPDRIYNVVLRLIGDDNSAESWHRAYVVVAQIEHTTAKHIRDLCTRSCVDWAGSHGYSN
jgi:hypothetical protein